ncbi:MAG: DegV family protein [Pseudomonadota bacterium]
MQFLDGDAMRLALRNGVQRVIRSQDGLNKINVFPVADGDTGTNLALTMGAMGQVLQKDESLPLHRLLARSADALLDGARGNSGAIMAQFFQGVSDKAAELTKFSASTFTDAVLAGSAYARDAIADPREGTILSVIDAFAHHLVERVKHTAQVDFSSLLDDGLKAANSALTATTSQLAELRKADVVDAGAKGFVHLLEGMLAYIRDGETIEHIDLPKDLPDAPMAENEIDLEYRFCTECVVTGDDIDRRKLREQLSAMGGSLVLAGSRYKAKIHVHVNEPDKVFALARDYGVVSGEKADDMHKQHSTHGNSECVAIITDSAADLRDDDMEALDIHMVPLRVQFGEQGYLDKLSIGPSEFFDLLATTPEHPTTSQPSPGDFRRQYQFLASHHNDVLAVSLSSKVSGTTSAAQSAASRVMANGKVHIVDSRNASLGQGLIAKMAAEMAQAGDDIDTIRAAVDQAIDNTHTFALVKDLTYAVRGGRVPASRKMVADWLNINPVLRTSPDGSVSSGGMILGKNNRLPKFVRYIAKRFDTNARYRLAVGHAQCEDDAKTLEKLLLDAFPNVQDSVVTECGAVFGVHGGPGLIVIGLMKIDTTH